MPEWRRPPTLVRVGAPRRPGGRGRPFLPGQSGNPSGRGRQTQEERDLIAACKSKSPAALRTIERLMLHAEREQVQLQAAIFLIERGYGKAVQPTEERSPIAEAATDLLLAMRTELQARRAALAVAPPGVVGEPTPPGASAP